MTRIPMWRAAVLAAGALALAACGGEEEEGGSFCDQMTDVQADLGSLKHR